MQDLFYAIAIFQYATASQAFKGSGQTFLQQKQLESTCQLIKYGAYFKHEQIFLRFDH